MFSSAATGFLLIYKEFGPDSYIGRLVSIIKQYGDDFYTMSVYLVAAGVKKVGTLRGHW